MRPTSLHPNEDKSCLNRGGDRQYTNRDWRLRPRILAFLSAEARIANKGPCVRRDCLQFERRNVEVRRPTRDRRTPAGARLVLLVEWPSTLRKPFRQWSWRRYRKASFDSAA